MLQNKYLVWQFGLDTPEIEPSKSVYSCQTNMLIAHCSQILTWRPVQPATTLHRVLQRWENLGKIHVTELVGIPRKQLSSEEQTTHDLRSSPSAPLGLNTTNDFNVYQRVDIEFKMTSPHRYHGDAPSQKALIRKQNPIKKAELQHVFASSSVKKSRPVLLHLTIIGRKYRQHWGRREVYQTGHAFRRAAWKKRLKRHPSDLSL